MICSHRVGVNPGQFISGTLKNTFVIASKHDYVHDKSRGINPTQFKDKRQASGTNETDSTGRVGAYIRALNTRSR